MVHMAVVMVAVSVYFVFLLSLLSESIVKYVIGRENVTSLLNCIIRKRGLIIKMVMAQGLKHMITTIQF